MRRSGGRPRRHQPAEHLPHRTSGALLPLWLNNPGRVRQQLRFCDVAERRLYLSAPRTGDCAARRPRFTRIAERVGTIYTCSSGEYAAAVPPDITSEHVS
jgi:hypothetical protein